jgi:glycosyltransferase involved in cell wall biosynthesis
MPKLALAHDHLFQKGGAERVLATLASLDQEAPIYTLINDQAVTAGLFDQKRIKTSTLQKIPGINRFFRYFLWRMPKTWEETDLSEYDIVLSSASAFVKGLKKSNNTKHICYCHAPTRYLWGDKDEYLGNLPTGKVLKIILPYFLQKMQSWDYAKAQNVDLFIANSRFIADKIKQHYNREAEVIYPSIKINDFKISDQVEDYYLIVSRLRPYKKVDIAIQAFNNMKLPLKIIGAGSEMDRLKKMAGNNIEFLGEISDKDRNHYLSRCRAFLYPQVEDFGITALEAMASGRPVIAYAKGGALETVIDGTTGVFFEHQNWASLTHAVLRSQTLDFDPQFIHQYAARFDEKIFLNKIRELINIL